MKIKESLKNQIYNAILNGILSGEFKPEQILTERELVDKYGCSKAPVREALITLCNDDILRSFPRYGYENQPAARPPISYLSESDTDILIFPAVLLRVLLLNSYDDSC